MLTKKKEKKEMSDWSLVVLGKDNPSIFLIYLRRFKYISPFVFSAMFVENSSLQIPPNSLWCFCIA